jgi:hypothetical protein
MDPRHHALPILTLVTGLAWMAAVLLIAAEPKDISVAGDFAYDRANRIHTLALGLLLITAVLIHRTVRAGNLPGTGAAKILVIGAALMLVGNVVSFWGALLADGTSEQFWGGLAGWLIFLPGMLLLLGAPIGLALAARGWPGVTRAQRWMIGLVGLFLVITTITWAISPAATIAPALLGAAALLTLGTTLSRASAPMRA